MIGLLEKARKLRTSLGMPEGRDEFAFDPDSGISREEQTEIRAEIEKVATGSRIAASPEVFAVKAAKRGVLFPVMVNAVALMGLAVGLAVLYFSFQQGETQISRADAGTITAEGKLIAQVKKESDAKLQEKNQQINAIQGQLADIDRQRQDLQANMDAKVQERESALKAAMAAALDAEKARLQKQGLSDKDIERKLADLQTQQDATYTKELNAFKAQAEAERQESEATLKTLQDQFNADLAKANADRQQVLADSRQREAELSAQLSLKTTELQAAQAQTQQQLQSLASQKQQEDLVSQQLVGLYGVVKSDIAAKDYSKAFTSLKAIADYFNSPDVAVLPGIAERRPVDLFIVDSLTSLVQGEVDKTKVDTTSLTVAANQLATVRARVADAEAQVQAGKIADAERLYNEAIAVVPEIARSYAYFTSKAKDAETERLQVMRAGLARAEAAFASRRYSDMLSAYRDALAYLPEPAARVEKTLSNVEAAGAARAATGAGGTAGTAGAAQATVAAASAAQATAAAQAAEKAQAEQSRAAAPILTQADSLYGKGQFADAATQYLTILGNYPQSSQAARALKGTSDSFNGMSGQTAAAQAAQKSLGDSIASLSSDLADQREELTGIRKGIIDLLGLKADPASADTAKLMDALSKSYHDQQGLKEAASDYEARLSSAQNRNAELQKQVEELNAKLTDATAAANQQNAKLNASEARQFQNLQDRMKTLQTGYQGYTTSADKALQTPGDLGLMRAKGYLDTFLGSGPVENTFPGLLKYIQRFDRGFQSAGRSSALQDAMSIVMDFSKASSTDERSAFFKKQLQSWDNDPDMKSFLQALQILAK